MKPTFKRALSAAVACAAVAAALAASSPAAATDLASLRERAQRVADEVTALERRLAGLTGRRVALEAGIARTTAAIAALEVDVHEVDAAYHAAADRYVARAVEAYKQGPAQRWALMLSADTFGDLVTLRHAAAEVAALDAEAAADLQDARADVERAQEALDDRKQQLLAARARVETVAADIASAVGDRRATLRRLNADVAALEDEVRRTAASAPDPSASVLDRLEGSGPAQGIPAGFVGSGVTFEGVASWYGPGFEGNPTANGDIFDPDLFTAASKELPLGSWLYVEHGGKGVVVLVNDRGPYVGGRILDLSRAAAFAIGITGLGWVECEVLFEV